MTVFTMVLLHLTGKKKKIYSLLSCWPDRISLEIRKTTLIRLIVNVHPHLGKKPLYFPGNLLDLPDAARMISTAQKYLHSALSCCTGDCFTCFCYQNLSLLLGYSYLC